MSAIDVEKAKEAIRHILSEGQREGKLNQLTVRIVLQQAEQQLVLQENTLLEGEHKKPLKSFIKEEINTIRAAEGARQDDNNDEPGPAKPRSSKKRKSDVGDAASAKKRSGTGELDRKQSPRKSKPVPGGTIGKEADAEPLEEKKRGGSFKSKDTIDTDSEPEAESSKREVEASSPDSLSKGTKRKSSEVAVENERPESPEVKPEEPAQQDGYKSDSELSVLIDGPPTKRTKKNKSKTVKSDTKKASRQKKSESALSTSEEQIKKLKSLVVACGLRKVWSKELKDCDTPSSQIAHLRKLLSELGMKGRFSLEQAKSIRAKRELAQELEDVRDFAERHTSGRPKRASGAKKQEDSDVGDESDESERLAPRQRKSAHASIMAFLGDQSGDSE